MTEWEDVAPVRSVNGQTGAVEVAGVDDKIIFGMYPENIDATARQQIYDQEFNEVVNSFGVMATVARYDQIINEMIDDEARSQMIAESLTAMEAVSVSKTAMVAIAGSQTAMDAVVASDDIAFPAVVASQVAMDAVAESGTAMNSVAASKSAMDQVAASNAAMRAVAASEPAVNEVIPSVTARSSFLRSSYTVDEFWTSEWASGRFWDQVDEVDNSSHYQFNRISGPTNHGVGMEVNWTANNPDPGYVEIDIDVTDASTLYVSTAYGESSNTLSIRLDGNGLYNTSSPHGWTERSMNISSYTGVLPLQMGNWDSSWHADSGRYSRFGNVWMD